ncbi:MAG: UDP-N-acetylglucosamine 2-epimerase (non-hydrolyzing) [Desulfovibrio sp.]|nr:UDP-N-acetylglucosamine 2-epimerase (non-hydrolyzing) [Desulfovibrio sp.]
MKVVSLVGARPQFIKEALVGEAARAAGAWEHVLVHSGQHYDARMSDVFFQELGIPEPKYHLGVGSGSHAAMTAAVLTGLEKALLEERPDALLVYGDTNTTLAGALAAAKLRIPVAHVEAGVRMAPKTMPEEINRVLSDHLAAILCCCSSLGRENLAREGITSGVFVSGDVLYDLYVRMRERFEPEAACARYGLEPGSFLLATLHRDYNVDERETLRGCLEGLVRLGAESGLSVLLPLHPRTRKNIETFGCGDAARRLVLAEPPGYLELMSLTLACAFVLTDSGGLQKEAFYAGRRAVVIMPDTGWRELTDCGWNILCEPRADAIAGVGESLARTVPPPGNVYGEGNAAGEIVRAVRQQLS